MIITKTLRIQNIEEGDATISFSTGDGAVSLVVKWPGTGSKLEFHGEDVYHVLSTDKEIALSDGTLLTKLEYTGRVYITISIRDAKKKTFDEYELAFSEYSFKETRDYLEKLHIAWGEWR